MFFTYLISFSFKTKFSSSLSHIFSKLFFELSSYILSLLSWQRYHTTTFFNVQTLYIFLTPFSTAYSSPPPVMQSMNLPKKAFKTNN
jgi:hypothetical protein